LSIEALFNFALANNLHFFGLVLTGAIVGLAVGITGVGGGSLMTPALISGFGINPAVAVGTDLAFAAITKTVGVAAHHNTKMIHWKVTALLIASSVPGCLLALATMQDQPSHTAQFTIKRMLAIALVLTVIALLLKNHLPQFDWKSKSSTRALRVILTIVAGLLIGWAVGWSSIGAGAIGCTVLTLLYPEWSTQEVAATDIAYAVPLTAIGAIGHGLLGHIDFALLLALLIGSTPAIWCGVKLGRRLTPATSRNILAGLLSVAAAKSWIGV
jgi:uncharacterized protein